MLENTYNKRKTVTSKHKGYPVLMNNQENEHIGLSKEQIIAKAKMKIHMDSKNLGKTLHQLAKFKNLLPSSNCKNTETHIQTDMKEVAFQK